MQKEDLFKKEEAYLQEVLEFLKTRKTYLEAYNARLEEESIELKALAWEDHLELGETDTNAQYDSAVIQNELAHAHEVQSNQAKELAILPKLMERPYFGHMTFAFTDGEETGAENDDIEEIYIGLKDLVDYEGMKQYVTDWRAPLASVYYDVTDLGPVDLRKEGVNVLGRLLAKYQVVITKGQLDRVINTTEQIYDDILQMVLSRVSSARMKEIVQSLQKEQHLIVREEPKRNLLIQGVAGSGKTSIALHRAAYLMYVDKNMQADNILLITPSDSFATYVGEVLPSLGEENVRYMTADRVLREEIGTVQGRYVNYPFVPATMEKKVLTTSYRWLGWIEEFASYVTENGFAASDMTTPYLKVPASLLDRLYKQNYKFLPYFQRREAILRHLQDLVDNKEDYDLSYDAFNTALSQMFLLSDLVQSYQVFLRWLEEEKDVDQKFFDTDKFDSEDLIALGLMKVLLYGPSDTDWVMHLIVDEMQDLSYSLHAFLRRTFNCPRTLLGDVNQAINFPLEDDYLDKLADIYHRDPIKTLTYNLDTSYRSTRQITEFARKIVSDHSIRPLNREGQAVGYHAFAADAKADLFESLYKQAQDWKKQGYKTALFTTKTEEEAAELKTWLDERNAGEENPILINAYLQVENDFALTVCPVRESKGVEFDAVGVVDCSAENYHTAVDRTLLYVAVTRALHALEIYSLGQASDFLPQDLR